jgi:hypothetical protein
MTRGCALAPFVFLLAVTGCSRSDPAQTNAAPAADLATDHPPLDDLGPQPTNDMDDGDGAPDVCGDAVPDPFCHDVGPIGPPDMPFPLSTDPQPNPREGDANLVRDASGHLELDGAHSPSQGTYRFLFTGCRDQDGAPLDTLWWAIVFDGTVPAGASLAVHARSSDATRFDDPAWAGAKWTVGASVSPLDLQATLTPDLTPQTSSEIAHDSQLLIEFVFRPSPRGASPVLRSFDVAFKCPFHDA